MIVNQEGSSPDTHDPKSRGEVVIEELIADVLITTIIVWALVLLGEPLVHVLTSPLFIILTVAGLAHLAFKALRHNPRNTK